MFVYCSDVYIIDDFNGSAFPVWAFVVVALLGFCFWLLVACFISFDDLYYMAF